MYVCLSIYFKFNCSITLFFTEENTISICLYFFPFILYFTVYRLKNYELSHGKVEYKMHAYIEWRQSMGGFFYIYVLKENGLINRRDAAVWNMNKVLAIFSYSPVGDIYVCIPSYTTVPYSGKMFLCPFNGEREY